ncbi:MAG: hypothetical protein HZA01_04095 [Nitrospinae bacterium]|nr:hypothetical protein [Nitrospinota bacterium]
MHLTYTEHRLRYGKLEPVVPSRFLDEVPGEAVQRMDAPEEEAPDPEQEARDAKAFFANMREILGR